MCVCVSVDVFMYVCMYVCDMYLLNRYVSTVVPKVYNYIM